MYPLGLDKNIFTFQYDIKNQVGGEEEHWKDVVVDDIEAGKVANLEPSVSAGVTVTKVLSVAANLTSSVSDASLLDKNPFTFEIP